MSGSYETSSCFFSSRRRHTRLQGDWSSDVCSSDLLVLAGRSPVGLAEADVVLEQRLASYGVQVLREAEVTGLDARQVTVTTPTSVHKIGRASCRERG